MCYSGSLKFQKEMMMVAEKMALEGNCILTPAYPVLENIYLKKNIGNRGQVKAKIMKLQNQF